MSYNYQFLLSESVDQDPDKSVVLKWVSGGERLFHSCTSYMYINEKSLGVVWTSTIRYITDYNYWWF